MQDQLTTSTPDFSQTLDLLSAGHRRIAGYIEALQKLPAHLAQHGADADARQVAGQVLNYFDNAGGKHHDDEDLDLFPLLHAVALQQGNSEIVALLEDLTAQHAEMTQAWTELHPFLLALSRDGSAAPMDEQVRRVVALYRKHIPLEENFLLPFAERTLDTAQTSALGQAMALRRNVV